MKPENEINEEVRQLLDSIEEHGKNRRRQQQLSELMDSLSEKEKPLHSPLSTLYFIWWAMGAAAACLLLWVLFKPNVKQQSEMEQEILVEETKTLDSSKTEVPEVILETPVAEEELLAAETTNETGKSESGLLRSSLPRNDVQEKHKNKTIQEQLLAENTTTEPLESPKPTDTANIGSNHTPIENETPSAVQKPQRRVIRSLNLVCYECQVEQVENEGWEPLDFHLSPLTSHLSPFPKDPNMKNGSLALEIKLN